MNLEHFGRKNLRKTRNNRPEKGRNAFGFAGLKPGRNLFGSTRLKVEDDPEIQPTCRFIVEPVDDMSVILGFVAENVCKLFFKYTKIICIENQWA